MRVLVIGSGGREHALCHRIARSKRLSKLFILPGNPGTSELGANVAGDPNDLDLVVSVAKRERIDLTVVGPEEPLAAGIVDRFEAENLRIFGPRAAAARLEADKAFAKQLMRRAGVPTADGRIFAPTQQEALQRQEAARRGRSPNEPLSPSIATGFSLASEYIRTRDEPIVVKASGLAKGKGVFVCDSPAEGLLALERLMVQREFGGAGDTVVVEEKLNGREVSVMALVDGRNIYMLEAAQDYKRLLDGDAGPNTGGMGAFCPSPHLDDATLRHIESLILVPTVDALLREDVPYRGVLYAGLMLTANGPRVLEFNCRFGDPEAQVILSRLRTDILDVFEATLAGELDRLTLDWDPRPAVCVVMAARGYPGEPEAGDPISGLPEAQRDRDVTVFHAGARQVQGIVQTAGGRVLGVTALGEDLSAARRKAYAAVEQIKFAGAHYRRDIGLEATAGPNRISAP